MLYVPPLFAAVNVNDLSVKDVVQPLPCDLHHGVVGAEGLDILGNDPAAILKVAQEKIEREL